MSARGAGARLATGRAAVLAGLCLLVGAAALAGPRSPADPGTPVHSKSPAEPKTTPETPAVAVPSHQVTAYYFFMNFRCPSCRKIEAWSHEAIDAAFAKELKEGRLVWRPVNVEEKGNEHFMKDYKLFTKSLVIVDERDGREVRWKNLGKVWELLRTKDAFVAYVQNEVRGYLTETS
ncbi:MAG: nitrophenyl compound nitroreductase subunit ArsF family protein [bacterium]